ncbi:peptidase M48 family protein (plasmid) [Sphingobium yanoikuyae]|uniref:Peptidase M48 family protein n=1 Tax=Sphingobium yanoikuyae TaxID=13690 RepID=A0A6M4GH49_SPHYA|nr:M48 family metallopeptidase [Sphingobium yanoikuyae]QJR06248.1 peptidase M48 family protein [Sphingobium yanoikuyae]
MMKRQKIVAWCIAWAIILMPGVLASANEPPPFEAIRAVEAEMAAIGYRLAIANAPLCDRQEPGLGLLLHTPDQYAGDARAAAIRHFRFEGPVGVEAVLSGSPAAAAGVQPDDTVLGVEKKRFGPANRQAKAGTTALMEAIRQIVALPTDRPLVLHLRRNGAEYDRMIVPLPACRSQFELVLGSGFVAQADGEIVQIGSRFFADYPQWVAAPIAHELAHNILRHRERLEAQGVNYGLLSGFGRNVRYFRQTELEADILSVSLLANAGYDPKIALLFWQTFGPAHGASILRSRSHPGWKARVAVMERAIVALGPEHPDHPAVLAARSRPLDGNWQALLGERH